MTITAHVIHPFFLSYFLKPKSLRKKPEYRHYKEIVLNKVCNIAIFQFFKINLANFPRFTSHTMYLNLSSNMLNLNNNFQN